MTTTSGRLLRLLSLLQARRDWPGVVLADRLGVTTRTIRQDVQRLRELGYPIEGTPGVAGGYRLGAGADLPPLLLEDDEAVAVAIGLGAAADGTVNGIEESALRALAKLDRVLPSRLRRRVHAVTDATSTIRSTAALVDGSVLVTTSAAVRDREVLRFDYRRHDGETARREAEPHRLVHAGRRWYLVGWDLARRDWRTYRMDRMSLRVPNGRRFAPRDPPEGGFDQYFKRALSVNSWPVVGRFLLLAPARELLGISQLTEGMIEPVDEHSCLLTVGADSVSMLFVLAGIYDVDFTVLGPPGAVQRAAELAERYRLASQNSPSPEPPGAPGS